MPLTYAQTSFAGGEFSPQIWTRVDLAKYTTGLKYCRNMIPHVYGGASNRPGTYFVSKQGDETAKARVIPYIFSRSQAYALEFGVNYIRFFTDQGQIAADSPATWSAATTYDAFEDFVTYNADVYYSIKSGTDKNPSTETTYWTQQEAYEISAPYAASELPYLDVKSSADIIYITCPTQKTRKLTRSGDASWALSEYDPQDGPFLPENVDTAVTLSAAAVTGTGITLSSASAVFDDDHVGALWKLVHYIEGQTESSSFTATSAAAEIKCFTTWRIISHGTWTGKIRVEKSIDGGTTWTILRTFTSEDDFNINTSGTEDIEIHSEPFLVRANCFDYTSGTCNVDLTTDAFYQEGIVEITAVNSATEAICTVLQDIGLTTSTYSWSEGAWSDYRGWPAVNAFQQDRLCLGGAEAEPMSIKMSKTGDYESHGRNSLSLLDTDAIGINLLSRQINPILSIIPLSDLLIFTSGSEWVIGSDSGIITPTTVRQKPQGYRGSSTVQPIVIGNQVIYVQSNGKVVRNFEYRDTSAGYTGDDIRVLAEHLFEGRTVADMAYQQDPDSLIWIVLDNGDLISCTYLYEQEVISWAKHPTDGVIESICVIPADGYDEVWMSVNRDGGRFIERMVQRMASTDSQDQFFVDSGLSFNNPVSISSITKADPGVVSCAAAHALADGDYVDIVDIVGMTELNGNRYKVANVGVYDFELTDEETGDDVSTTLASAYVSGGTIRRADTVFYGLDHLEGQDVAILGNGKVYPQQTVATGQVTLPAACSRVHVGLPYTADLAQLNVHIALKSGSMIGSKVKIGNVTFRFINSRGGYIGPDDDNLYEAFIPNEYLDGVPVPLFTGEKREPLGGGYEDGGSVFYRQVDPLPVTIAAIEVEIEVGG